MKEKLANILRDEKKKTLLILIVVTLIISIILVTLILVMDKNKKMSANKTTLTTTTSTKLRDIFRGFETTEYSFSEETSKTVTYDLKSKHEFIYANGEDKKTIYTNFANKELYYEVSLNDGKMFFKEQRYNSNLKAYEFTGKNYSFDADSKITDYLVVQTCAEDTYSIIAKDAKSNVYVFDTPDTDFDIDYVIKNLKQIKVISKVKKIGYYNYNNYPHRECNEYDLVYLDNTDNVRYIVGKNALFFDDVYYRYIGSGKNANYIYVLKDGLMQFDNGNTKKLNDGNYNITYMGSFYTLDNEIENLYIIATNGYIYKIENFKEDSSTVLEKVNKTRIEKIGTRVETDDKNYAKDTVTVKILFEDNEVIELTNVYEYELLG